jgi:hypothetical protein
MAFFIETDKGFDHGYCFWGNINVSELLQFDSYQDALERKQELLEEKEVRWAEIKEGTFL